jgi:hypothetical protein
MPASTPIYGLPYPLGTDRVMDGDNAIGALAAAVEQLIATGPRLLGYAEVLAPGAPVTAAVPIPGLSVSVTLPAGRRIRVTAHVNYTASQDNNVVRQRLRVDGVNSQLSADTVMRYTQVHTVVSIGVFTPAAGAHTFDVTCQMAYGTGTVNQNGSADAPAFIMVEDIGPAVIAAAELEDLAADAPDTVPAI